MGTSDPTMPEPTITAADGKTFRIHAPGGVCVDGGLGPDSLTLGDGRVVVGPVTCSEADPDVYYMSSWDESGWEVFLAPFRNDADPFPLEDDEGPMSTLERLPAWEQVEILREGVRAAMAYTCRVPCLDEQLRAAATGDLPLDPRHRAAVARAADPHLGEPRGGALPTGEQERFPTPRLADAVERITGDRPRNHVQVRSLLRRWAVLRATAGCLPTR